MRNKFGIEGAHIIDFHEVKYDRQFLCFFLGPPSGVVVPHNMYMCIAAHARRHMRDPTFDLIDETSCSRVGRVLEAESPERMQLYPIGNVVLYTQIPYIKSHVMSRLFQFMVADLGIQFTSSEFPEKLMSECILECKL